MQSGGVVRYVGEGIRRREDPALITGRSRFIADLTEAYVRDDGDLNALGWGLTAVAARVCGALGAYRPPRDEGGGLFLI